MRCMECGANNDDDVRFCTACGADLMAAEPVYGPLHKSKSNGTAIILGIALVIIWQNGSLTRV